MAFPRQLDMQSPQPLQNLGLTIAGSVLSIWKIALIEQAFAALQSEHRRHFSGLIKALCMLKIIQLTNS